VARPLLANAGRTPPASPTVPAYCSIHVAPSLKWWPPFAYGALGISSGFIMKSCGVPAAPLSAKALPGSDRLVPKTTIPENDDCAAAMLGTASNANMQATINFRANDGEMRAVVIMDVSSQ
jgi:hypothetical protein